MNDYTLVSKFELYSAMINLLYMPEFDGTKLTSKIRKDTKAQAKRLAELVGNIGIKKVEDLQ